MKQKFINELEKILLKNFVVLCGGDPNLVDKNLKIFLNDSSEHLW